MMNQKPGHRLSKLPYDGDPWAPNNLPTPEQKRTRWAKQQTRSSGPKQLK